MFRWFLWGINANEILSINCLKQYLAFTFILSRVWTCFVSQRLCFFYLCQIVIRVKHIVFVDEILSYYGLIILAFIKAGTSKSRACLQQLNMYGCFYVSRGQSTLCSGDRSEGEKEIQNGNTIGCCAVILSSTCWKWRNPHLYETSRSGAN